MSRSVNEIITFVKTPFRELGDKTYIGQYDLKDECRNCGTNKYYHEIYKSFGDQKPYTYYCNNFETKDNLLYLEQKYNESKYEQSMYKYEKSMVKA